jgi:CRISPR-associated protein Cas6
MREDDPLASARTADPGDIVDAVFAISCRSLPVDHAYPLSQAIGAALPWFGEEPLAGLHLVHGASSGSGWMRPEGPDAVLHLPRRAKLALRLPAPRLPDAAALLGRTLDVAGSPLVVDRLAVRALARIADLFARGVVMASIGDEADFLAAAEAELATLGIRAGRILCGRTTRIATPSCTYEARSVMLAGLSAGQSLALQKQGLGTQRKLGCGLFIPHKGIGDLGSGSDNDR